MKEVIVFSTLQGEFEDGDPWKSILEGEIMEDHETPIPEPEINGSTAQDAPESPCPAS